MSTSAQENMIGLLAQINKTSEGEGYYAKFKLDEISPVLELKDEQLAILKKMGYKLRLIASKQPVLFKRA